MSYRVLFVMAELTHSGAETMLCAIGTGLRSQGVEAHVLSTGERQEGVFADRLRAAGYVVHHVPFRRRPGYLLDVWRLLCQGRFGIVHIHCERGSFWLGLLAALVGARVFRSVHGIFHFHGGLRWRRSLQRWLSRRMGVVFTAPSAAVADNESRRFGNPCRRLNNWIDTDRFTVASAQERRVARERLGLAEDRFVLLSVGSCQAVKNHAAIIEAVALMPDRVVYLHAGDGPLAQDEIALAERLGVGERVRRLGLVDDVPGLLAAADVFVMPSSFEALGLAAAEALASGVPCVLGRTDGLREVASCSGMVEWCDPSPASIAAASTALMGQIDAALPRGATADAIRAAYGHEAGLGALLALYGEVR